MTSAIYSNSSITSVTNTANSQAAGADRKTEYGEFAKTLAEVKQNSASGRFTHGEDAVLGLGILALGHAKIEDWEEKGLELSKETLLMAVRSSRRHFLPD